MPPYRRLVRRPGYEDPLIALGVLSVQAIQDVAGLQLVQQGQQDTVIVLVPALLHLPVGPQHQLL